MSAIPVNLAVEDRLSDTTLRRILKHTGRGYAIGTTYGLRGSGYLRKTIGGWNRASSGTPFVILTDLDRYPCPPALLEDWLHEPRSPNLLVRIAVREIEAWLLADRANLARYLNVPEMRVPNNPDSLPDAKASLVELARMSKPKGLRSRIVPRAGSTAKQGPDYNAALSEFINSRWDVDAARANSPSLGKAIAQFLRFTPTWHDLSKIPHLRR